MMLEQSRSGMHPLMKVLPSHLQKASTYKYHFYSYYRSPHFSHAPQTHDQSTHDKTAMNVPSAAFPPTFSFLLPATPESVSSGVILDGAGKVILPFVDPPMPIFGLPLVCLSTLRAK